MKTIFRTFDGEEFDTETAAFCHEKDKFPEVCHFRSPNLEPTKDFGQAVFLKIPKDWDKSKIRQLQACFERATCHLHDFVTDADGITCSGEYVYTNGQWVSITSALKSLSEG